MWCVNMDHKTKIKYCITNKRLKKKSKIIWSPRELSKPWFPTQQSKAMITFHSLDRVRTRVKQEKKAHSEQTNKQTKKIKPLGNQEETHWSRRDIYVFTTSS